jgi:hypothetical protein
LFLATISPTHLQHTRRTMSVTTAILVQPVDSRRVQQNRRLPPPHLRTATDTACEALRALEHGTRNTECMNLVIRTVLHHRQNTSRPTFACVTGHASVMRNVHYYWPIPSKLKCTDKF